MNLWRFYTEDLIRIGTLGHRLYIMKADDLIGERYSVVENMTFCSMGPYSFIPQDKATLDDSKLVPGVPSVKTFLQAASDAAWEIGAYPKQLENRANELKAIRYHLEDMRQLARVKK